MPKSLFFRQEASINWLAQVEKWLIAPHSTDEEARRSEQTLNILLVGSVGVSLLALITVIVSNGPSIAVGFAVFVVMCGLLVASRLWSPAVAAWSLSILYVLLAFYAIIRWGIDLPTGILVFALGLTMSTVLLSRVASLIFSILTIAGLVGVGAAQASGTLNYDATWVGTRVSIGDAIGYALVLGIMLMVHWLSNRELDNSLARARKSEAQLKIERDRLEERVAERTKQLEAEHFARYSQLARFAAFGRLTSGIIHELVTPLTTVAMNLEQMRGHVSPETLERAVESTKRMESYIQAARKQLAQRSDVRVFRVNSEIRSAMTFLEQDAKKYRARVDFRHEDDVRLSGNPVKFYQLVTNLIRNALEAYGGTSGNETRRVVVDVRMTGDSMYLSVQDWGQGIAPEDLSRVFEPLYSTKASEGMGLGLALCKEIVEEEFDGHISAASSQATGTIFSVQIPLRTRQAD